MGGIYIMDFNIFFNSRAAIESRIFSVGLRKLLHHTRYYYNILMLLFVMSIPILSDLILNQYYTSILHLA